MLVSHNKNVSLVIPYRILRVAGSQVSSPKSTISRRHWWVRNIILPTTTNRYNGAYIDFIMFQKECSMKLETAVFGKTWKNNNRKIIIEMQ